MPMILTTIEAIARILPCTTKFDSFLFFTDPLSAGPETGRAAGLAAALALLLFLLSIEFRPVILVRADHTDPSFSLI